MAVFKSSYWCFIDFLNNFIDHFYNIFRSSNSGPCIIIIIIIIIIIGQWCEVGWDDDMRHESALITCCECESELHSSSCDGSTVTWASRRQVNFSRTMKIQEPSLLFVTGTLSGMRTSCRTPLNCSAHGRRVISFLIISFNFRVIHS